MEEIEGGDSQALIRRYRNTLTQAQKHTIVKAAGEKESDPAKSLWGSDLCVGHKRKREFLRHREERRVQWRERGLRLRKGAHSKVGLSVAGRCCRMGKDALGRQKKAPGGERVPP